MLIRFQEAVDAVIEEVASDGTILDVNACAAQIVGFPNQTDDPAYDEVALALIKAASRRSVAMTFCNPNA